MLLGYPGQDSVFGVGQVGPGGVVGIAVDDCRHLSVGAGFLQTGLQGFAAAVVDVDRAVSQAEELHLVVLGGESRIKEKDGVLSGDALSHEEKQSESALHGAYGRDDAPRGDVYVEECAEEIASGFLELRDTGDIGIGAGHAVKQGLALGLDADSRGGEPRVAHFQMDEVLAQRFPEAGGQGRNLADGGGGDVRYMHGFQRLPEYFRRYGLHNL